MPIPSACRSWTSTPSARAAAASPTAGPTARWTWGRGAPGALPGPASYGRGGTAADDLGREPAAWPAGQPTASSAARWPSRADLARAALERLRQDLGEADLHRLAEGVIRLAVMKMAGAVREVSVHRGVDPRDYPLLGFGGAGPMHVFQVAEELDITTVLIPRFPGHLSALGQLFAPYRTDLLLARKLPLDGLDEATLDSLDRINLAAEAARLAAGGRSGPMRSRMTFTADLRYVGQSFTLAVALPPAGPRAERTRQAALRAGFDAAHRAVFGHARPEHGVELVNLRLVATLPRQPPRLEPPPQRAWLECDPDLAPSTGTAPGTTPPSMSATPWPPGQRVAGPAIIHEPGGTTALPPGWTAEIETYGSMLCRRDAARLEDASMSERAR